MSIGAPRNCGGQAQVARLDAGLLAHFPQRRGQERPVVLDMAARSEEQPRDLVADVQNALVLVDDHRAAGDVTGGRGTAGRGVGSVQEGQQPG